ncbi:UNVERIFIED_CONTAM: hypothetical protein GTU68_002866 [Idotea baltica]|nr:hypothetical protein [Idotea baltica]
MSKFCLLSGCVLALLGVVFGAFGAHALTDKLTPDSLQSYETAVRYQFYHAFALLICGVLAFKIEASLLKAPSYLFLVGTILFSGSIYLLSTRAITGITQTKILGPITPIGGTLLIIAWALLAVQIYRSTN